MRPSISPEATRKGGRSCPVLIGKKYQAGDLSRRFYKPEKTAPKGVEGVSKDGYLTAPKEKSADVEIPEGEKIFSPRRKEPDLVELVRLSEKFKEHGPDRGISTAALQGWVMMHKDRPYDAVECFGTWVREV